MASDNITPLITQLGMRLDQQEQRIQEQAQRIQELETENERLKQLLKDKGASKASKPPKFTEDYSVDKHKGKGKSKRGRQSTGRCPQQSKLELLDSYIDVYEAGVSKSSCIERRRQYVWRIIDGKATYICYRLFARLESQPLPTIAGVRNSLSEYGIEIILIVAFLHYWVGLSIDYTCRVVQFFTGLALSKSQANSLLEQLSRDWQGQYETIAELLTRQLVLYIDETGWKVGPNSCYTWAFSTVMHVLFRCGVGRGKAEAQAIVGEKFEGIGVSDDYGAYQSLFSEHQLCWAHLLRKAIKLTLQHPEEMDYKNFLDELYRIYQQAVRWQKDQRLSVDRAEKVKLLKSRIRQLCTDAGTFIDLETMTLHQQAFIRVQNELTNSLDTLFVFVVHPQVEPTNNRSERNVRREAEVRKGGRTSKTDHGAQRRGIIMTVLATLNTRFEKFTLEKLLAEVARWMDTGISLFQAELAHLKQADAPSTA
ncbi:MAG: transposase [Cyanobacteria bacterium P01_G01_bin.38]